MTGQALGVGDGVTTAFQLVRSLGGFVEPILARNTVLNVYLNGTVQAGGTYSVSSWGAANPSVLTFNTPAVSGAIVTADFTYYWPCRFDMTSFDF